MGSANVLHCFCCQHGVFTCIHHTPLKHDYLTLLGQQKDFKWNPECFKYQYLVPCPQILHPHADLFIEIIYLVILDRMNNILLSDGTYSECGVCVLSSG